MRRPVRLAVLGLALCLALAAGCAPALARPAPESTFFAMDTVMSVKLYQGGDEPFSAGAGPCTIYTEKIWNVHETFTFPLDGGAACLYNG